MNDRRLAGGKTRRKMKHTMIFTRLLADLGRRVFQYEKLLLYYINQIGQVISLS